MEWEGISAVAEIIGATAVVISLIYVAIQIRQNSRMMRSNIREQRMGSLQQILFKWMDEAELMEKIENNDVLTPTEMVRGQMFIRAVYRGWESLVHQHRNGLFDEAEWKAVSETIRHHHAWPQFNKFWAARKAEFSSHLQEVIEQLEKERPTQRVGAAERTLR